MRKFLTNKYFLTAWALKSVVLIAVLLCGLAGPALADAVVGEKAPDFTAKDVNGQQVTLSELKGKTVVLEWTNYGCPFVRKHYDSGHMQALQKKYTGKGVVWIGVNSGAKGKEGYFDSDEAQSKAAAAKKAAYTHLIRDPSGSLGKLYGAKATPHMYVIDKEGILAYKGAIDDQPSVDPDTLKSAKNYVSAALDAVLSGGKPETAETQAYGCSVKY